jgi:hypothetical protein
MPFALMIIGILLVVAGARGKQTYTELKDLLVSDFTGDHNFFSWILALGVAGMFGYVPGMQKLSRAFLFLIFVGLFLANGKGFFRQFQSALAEYKSSSGSATSGNAGTSSATTAQTPATSTLPEVSTLDTIPGLRNAMDTPLGGGASVNDFLSFFR